MVFVPPPHLATRASSFVDGKWFPSLLRWEMIMSGFFLILGGHGRRDSVFSCLICGKSLNRSSQWLSGEESVCNARAAGVLSVMQVRSLGWEDPLEEEMTIHSSILA